MAEPRHPELPPPTIERREVALGVNVCPGSARPEPGAFCRKTAAASWVSKYDVATVTGRGPFAGWHYVLDGDGLSAERHALVSPYITRNRPAPNRYPITMATMGAIITELRERAPAALKGRELRRALVFLNSLGGTLPR